MGDKSDRRFPLWAILSVPVAVLALYMGVYYLLVLPGSAGSISTAGMRGGKPTPAYRLGGLLYGLVEQGAEWFFAPAHRFDTIVRPMKWDREVNFSRYIEKERQNDERKHLVEKALLRKKAEAEKSGK